MRDYKEWTGQERLASLKKTKEAIAAGIIPPPTKCNRCGKTTGRIDYHNHDYSDPVKYLEMLCQGCHTRLHRMENRAQAEATAADKAQKVPAVKTTHVKTQGNSMQTAYSAEEIFNSWLEKGMALPACELAGHLNSLPAGTIPLRALHALGVVFSGGHTKHYNCVGYPQKSGLGKDRERFDMVLRKVREYEKAGDSFKVKGFSLSEKLVSNFANNR